MDQHNESGHLNTAIRDQDSVVTNYGAHFRVVAFLPDADGLYCRVDHKHGARMPTADEVLTVARKDQGVRGRFKLLVATEYNNGMTTDFHFARN